MFENASTSDMAIGLLISYRGIYMYRRAHLDSASLHLDVAARRVSLRWQRKPAEPISIPLRFISMWLLAKAAKLKKPESASTLRKFFCFAALALQVYILTMRAWPWPPPMQSVARPYLLPLFCIS